MSKHKNTKHGKARISSRMNISKRRANSISKFAFSRGASHAETVGPLNLYINSLFLRYSYDKSATSFKIYQDFIFIFKNNRVVTSWELPEEYKKRKYIKESGFTDGKKPFKASTDPEGKPYEENKKQKNKNKTPPVGGET